MQKLLFSTEYEYSTDYKQGEIMRQDPAAGTAVEVGSKVIKLVISNGPKTAIMPSDIVGKPQADAEAQLKALGIQYVLFPMVNDGSFIEGTVAKCDTAGGTVVNVGKDTVTLSIANAPISPPSSSQPPVPDSSSTPTPPVTDPLPPQDNPQE